MKRETIQIFMVLMEEKRNTYSVPIKQFGYFDIGHSDFFIFKKLSTKPLY